MTRLAHPVLPTLRLVAATASMLLALLTLGHAPHADANSFTCHAWASVSGNDANDGSAQAPVRTVRRLVAVLTAGQTGCLAAGETFGAGLPYGDLVQIPSTAGTTDAPVTVRSAPGGRATFIGQLEVQAAAHDLVFRDLTFAGTRNVPKGAHLIVHGDRVQFLANDISNPEGICLDLGRIDAYSQTYRGERADDVRVDGNRIHNCGTSPNLTWSAGDSGAHGIYIKNTLNARITNNLIYDNQWRGLQTWPKAEQTLIANNVFDGNATNVNIGSALLDGYSWASTGTIVRDNVISNATLWRADKNSAQVHGNFPNDGTDYGNGVTGNCIFHADPSKNFSGYGYSESGNTFADPRYVDRAAKDFRLSAGSPCAGKGPAAATVTARTWEPATLTCTTRASGTARVLDVSSPATAAEGSQYAAWLPVLVRWDGTRWSVAQYGEWAWAQGSAAPAGPGWTRFSDGAAGGTAAFTVESGYYAVYHHLYWYPTQTQPAQWAGAWARGGDNGNGYCAVGR